MALLTVDSVSVVYGRAIDALSNVSIEVGEGRMSTLLGANGAGKSTMLKAISGVLEFERGRIVRGRVTFDGQDITKMPAHRRARLGLIHVREGRHILPSMSVEENLMVAGFAMRGRGRYPGSEVFQAIYDYFPVLGERRKSTAGFLSGGEQQMLAIGRALSANPRLVLIDEASLGLAPMIARQIFDILDRINQETGLSILIVEQNVGLALNHAEYVYVLENGRIALEGTPDNIGGREEISARYLGGVRDNAVPA
jgi:branched-chain amino acid transport system ATP-binding protein